MLFELFFLWTGFGWIIVDHVSALKVDAFGDECGEACSIFVELYLALSMFAKPNPVGSPRHMYDGMNWGCKGWICFLYYSECWQL